LGGFGFGSFLIAKPLSSTVSVSHDLVISAKRVRNTTPIQQGFDIGDIIGGWDPLLPNEGL
jgi:hypothetical protein